MMQLIPTDYMSLSRMLREAGLLDDVDAISSNEEEGPSNAPAINIRGSSMQV
jgi:hypothetical protein